MHQLGPRAGDKQLSLRPQAAIYQHPKYDAVATLLHTEPVGMVTSYVKTAGFDPALHPVAEIARDLTVSKHGSEPKKSVEAGILHELLPTHSFSILAFAVFRSHEGLAAKPVAQDPVGVPENATEPSVLTSSTCRALSRTKGGERDRLDDATAGSCTGQGNSLLLGSFATQTTFWATTGPRAREHAARGDDAALS